MFAHLDAEYACVLYDGKNGHLIAARDPIGIRPLFYGYSRSGAIAFASEAINLEGWVGEIRPFPPGYYYCDGQFVPYHRIDQVTHYLHADVEELTAGIHDRLIEAVRKRLDADAG